MQVVDYRSKYSLWRLHASGSCRQTSSSGSTNVRYTHKCLAKARPVSNIVICVLSWNRGRRIPELCIVWRWVLSFVPILGLPKDKTMDLAGPQSECGYSRGEKKCFSVATGNWTLATACNFTSRQEMHLTFSLTGQYMWRINCVHQDYVDQIVKLEFLSSESHSKRKWKLMSFFCGIICYNFLLMLYIQ
jgi:hypothetical protein